MSARIGVLFSGGGRTLVNLAHSITDGSLDAEIPVAISSHAACGGIERSRELGIPTEVVDFRDHKDDFSTRIWRILDEARVDWVALAGFIRFLDVPEPFVGRVLNIHPALLPAFGGKGYFGSRVHEAVIAAGAKFSGCTVHMVDDQYDHGPILVQRVVPVEPDDTPDTLAARVFEQECVAYPEALRLCLAGRVRVEGERAVIAPA